MSESVLFQILQIQSELQEKQLFLNQEQDYSSEENHSQLQQVCNYDFILLFYMNVSV